MGTQVGAGPAQQDSVTGVRVITRLDFGTDKFGGCWFSVWKAEQDGVTAAGSSEAQARARLAAALERARRPD